METPKQKLTETLSRFSPTVPWNEPEPRVGDLSTALPTLLARSRGRDAASVAAELRDALTGTLPPLIEGITVTEAGATSFLTFHYKWGELFESLTAAASNKEWLHPAAKSERILIEHTAVNPNKAMHIGHLRNSIIGDTLARLSRAAGHEVQVLNYIDDTGLQVAETLWGLLYLVEPRYEPGMSSKETWSKVPKDMPFDIFCWDLYPKAHARIQTENRTSEIVKILRDIEHGEEPLAELAAQVAAQNVERHLETTKRLGITYDLLSFESDIIQSGLWDETFELLQEKQIVVKETSGPHAGATVVKMGGETREDKILIKSDGTLTYTAKDLAFQLWKFGRLKSSFTFGKRFGVTSTVTGGKPNRQWGRANRVLNVIDVRQSYPQAVIKEALRRLGFQQEADRSVHLAYEVVNLSPQAARQLGQTTPGVSSNSPGVKKAVSMSGRAGIGIRADEVIDKTVELLQKRAVSKKVAEHLASAAIRYYMLRPGLNQQINFDFDEALRTDGDSGVYLMYAYARAHQILERARFPVPKTFLIPGEPTQVEKQLLRRLIELPDIVEDILGSYRPNLLIEYAQRLASAFTDFYEAKETGKIIELEDEKLQAYRLSLVWLFTQAMAQLFSLLGIEPQERI